jgi:hypothetical protein
MVCHGIWPEHPAMAAGVAAFAGNCIGKETGRMTPPLPQRVILSPEVLAQQIEDQTIMVDLQDERYFGLDDVGTNIWRLLAEQGDVAAVLERMLQIYQVDEITLRRDLADFIGRLAGAGLVTVES